MSHQPERREKDCLNCGTIIHGRFCHTCGQENVVVHQNFWSLTKHFVFDIFHFDGKFFETLKQLLFKPGKVPKEYIKGRRKGYLDPIRMYLFSSAIFFLIFFAFSNIDQIINVTGDDYLSRSERFVIASELYTQQQQADDSLRREKIKVLLDTTKIISLKKIESDSLKPGWLSIDYKGSKYRLMYERNAQPGFSKKGSKNWFEQRLEKRWDEFKKTNDDPEQMLLQLSDIFLHRLPYLLFISLPLMALILKLLYVRQKRFFYYDHAVFTLYLYIFTFILLLFSFAFNEAGDSTGWGIFKFLSTILLFSWPLYLLLGLKRFYMQSWGKTFLKSLLVYFLGSIALLILFVVFLLLSLLF